MTSTSQIIIIKWKKIKWNTIYLYVTNVYKSLCLQMFTNIYVFVCLQILWNIKLLPTCMFKEKAEMHRNLDVYSNPFKA